jgi:hypothetical protein
MKKFLIVCTAILASMTLFAQEEQDSPRMWIGGQVTFGSFSSRDLTIGPSFGLMFGERIGAGATPTFSTGNNSYMWGFDPYFRYYIPVVDQFSFYGDAYVGIGGGDSSTNIDNVGEYFSFSVGARLGLQYWFTPHWSVAASTRVFDFTTTDGNGELGAGINFNSVNFSLFFHF